MARNRKDYVTLETMMARFSDEDRVIIRARADELIAEHLTLQDLRKALALTQVQLGASLGIGQDQVSRIEKRADLLLSTLASYVEAMGGKLQLLVEFPDRRPVLLAGIGDVVCAETPRTRPRTGRKAAKPAPQVSSGVPAK